MKRNSLQNTTHKRCIKDADNYILRYPTICCTCENETLLDDCLQCKIKADFEAENMSNLPSEKNVIIQRQFGFKEIIVLHETFYCYFPL